MRSFGSGERGAVIVAYGPSVSYETAPKLLTALAARHPEVALSTDVRPTAEILEAVRGGSVDVGLVRCPPRTSELETWTIRLEPLGVLMLRDHPVAADLSVDLVDLADQTLLMHRREANPGHYDALLELCRERGVEPRMQLRALSFDPTESALVRGEAVAITGESSRAGLPPELVWLPIRPPAWLEVGLVARRYSRPPALERLLEAATPVAAELGWLRRHAAAS